MIKAFGDGRVFETEITGDDEIEALGLMPWMSPPCYPNMSALDQPYGDPGAKRELAQRMRRRGVSRWHPDPARACDEAEQRRAAK
ncbi:hypothetical protein [Bradyrhizobium sp. MOS002]|uniref:hypothetical protein n=1 Tax=Bradyrhizobium sp. MOS002 TaxID=2133947 RepID=UPI000D117221|nr:hypothetical protein [Bradyrhizobium sp. MOS002]PSO33414.1 hypothetical protein C7G41_00035 [Bradyrhizobium sp. MOS002]